MWRGTKEEYFELYDVTSRHLKACFPDIKVGGYASCGAYAMLGDKTEKNDAPERAAYWIEFFESFLDFLDKNRCPLDFFSWHSYDNVENTKFYARYFRDKLDSIGYTDAKMSCNEWNPCPTLKGTNKQASEVMAMMLSFQSLPVDTAMFYDAGLGISIYRALFHPENNKPYPIYYAFCAFNELYKLGQEVGCSVEGEGVYALAAVGEGRGALVISNTNATPEKIDLSLNADKISRCVMTAEGICYGEVPMPEEMPPYSFMVVEVEM